MKELEKSINEFTRVFSDEKDGSNNSLNCVSLYDTILVFNAMHNKFKEKYDALDKLDLGSKVDIDFFDKNDIDRRIRLLITDSKITQEEDVDLYIFDKEGEITAIVTNPDESVIYGKEIEIDKEKAIKLLDLFEHYQDLFNFYRYFKCNMAFGDGTYTLFTQIGTVGNHFTDNIDAFKVNFGSTFMNEPGDHYRVSVKLGDSSDSNDENSKYKLEIDCEDSKVNLDGKNINLTEEDYLYILKETCIDKKYFGKLEETEDVKTK